MGLRRNDTTARIIALDKSVDAIQERLGANRRQTELVEEALTFSQQLHHDQRWLLDELSYYLKGPNGVSRLLYEAADASESDYRYIATLLDEEHSELLCEKKTLRAKEVELHGEKARVAREAGW